MQPEKYAQDQEIIRWAYQDTYRDRGADLTVSDAVNTDKRLCGKWPILRDLLKTWHAKGDKVLLFSRSTRLLDALQWWIQTCMCSFFSRCRGCTDLWQTSEL